jgi:hypothetical protein
MRPRPRSHEQGGSPGKPPCISPGTNKGLRPLYIPLRAEAEFFNKLLDLRGSKAAKTRNSS